MKQLLLEYIIVHNQVQQFKTWLIDEGIYIEEGVEAWVDDELREVYLKNINAVKELSKFI